MFLSVSVMLKPASGACNLQCRYCFYSALEQHRSSFFKGFMQIATAQRVIDSALELAGESDVYFTFQGGEPLLRGLDFYEAFVSYVQQVNSARAKVVYCLQTNGTLLDEKWCAFFKKNHFLLGISLDGTKRQNANRVYPDGRPSFDDVMHGISLLKQYGVEFNVLSVLMHDTARSVRESYRFFKENGLLHLQFIAGLAPFDSVRSDDDLYMSCADYADFLDKAFRLYYNDLMRGTSVSVRQFDNFVRLCAGYPAEQCGMNGVCTRQFVVEGDGSVYPCDFYCTDDWLLGNIQTSSLAELAKTEKAKKFLLSSCVLPLRCKACRYLSVCRGGGCKRTRADLDYCNAYKDFFDKHWPQLQQISQLSFPRL